MSKTISKGTLGLRFMQNAQRAKQQAAIELEQAKIKDEAEWEVSQEVKEAWGIGSSSASTSTSVTHESSYIPFLFGDSAQTSKPKGRRHFNAKGQEIRAEVKPKEEPAAQPQDDNTQPKSDPKTRLVAISGFKPPVPLKSPALKKKDAKTGAAKTAQEVIREDLKKRPSSLSEPSTPPVFLKPSGVDAPSASHAKSARRDSTAQSLKRDRSAESADLRGTEGKKRKKGPKDIRTID